VAPRAATPASRPAASPARAAQARAAAFATEGSAALAVDSWEEF